jgi:hypothetical protein
MATDDAAPSDALHEQTIAEIRNEYPGVHDKQARPRVAIREAISMTPTEEREVSDTNIKALAS